MDSNYTLYNDFHATRAVVRPTGPDKRLTNSQVKRAWRKLCGMSDCTCGDEAGCRPSQVECIHQGATVHEDIYRIRPEDYEPTTA